jgi:signal transduction histidine kinase
VGPHFSIFYPEDDIPAGKPEAELELATAEGRLEAEGWRVRRDGSRFWADVIITALRGQDRTLRGFGKVTRDLTERKRAEDALRGMLRQERELAERLRELDQMKNEFVEIVAHDLRSPLVVISGFADLILRPNLPEDQRHEAAIAVSESAKNLAALVDDVLDVALLDSGGLKLDLASFDIVELCRELVRFFQPPSQPNRVSLRADGAVSAFGDRHRTSQVVSNLLANALKFSVEPAPVEVQVTRDGHEVLVSVADQGHGVAEEDMPKLFERFSRITPAGSPALPGTGLGLYIAKSIVEAHGGRIWAESEVGRGSTFYFSVPVPS